MSQTSYRAALPRDKYCCASTPKLMTHELYYYTLRLLAMVARLFAAKQELSPLFEVALVYDCSGYVVGSIFARNS